PVSAACLQCRSRHLKCDALTPVCSRCSEAGRECVYVKSRRGWKAKRKAEADDFELDRARAVTEELADTRLGFSTGGVTPETAVRKAPTLPDRLAAAAADRLPPLVDLYYGFFAPTHPFVVPRSCFLVFADPTTPGAVSARARAEFALYVVPAMAFAGSYYAAAPARPAALAAVTAALFAAPPTTGTPALRPDVARSPFAVMGLLLVGIVLHADNKQRAGWLVSGLAVRMALDLGMHQPGFAETYGGWAAADADHPLVRVLQESLRRTVWEAYVVEGFMAAIHMRSTFQLRDVDIAAGLPCDEADYEAARVPADAPTLADYDDRVYDDEPVEFSSYAYRIDAARVLAATLGLPREPGPRTQALVDLVETRASVWTVHLPEAKRTMRVRSPAGDLGLDELMFQAQMFLHATLIFLHKPLSDLAMIPTEADDDDSTCTPPAADCGDPAAIGSCEASASIVAPAFSPSAIPADARLAHTQKCLASANAITALVASAAAGISRHTPYLSCCISVAVLVQLTVSVWLPGQFAATAGGGGDPAVDKAVAREKVRLGIGTLKVLGQIWGTAGMAMSRLREISKTVY
ncbi:uncharacterized protein V1510DRAFT_347179, partial [Dipodascopsis tothii]|uniref:uncharacterized protein n=1 Tax=Dipodascopsis tothii TaxID=44089 RepID=UPI0034CFE59B